MGTGNGGQLGVSFNGRPPSGAALDAVRDVMAPIPLTVDGALSAVDVTAARWVPWTELRVWDKNPRKNDPAVPRVAASIRRFGFVAPIVVWLGGNRMVAGHTRLKAMASLMAADPLFAPKGAPGPGMVRVVEHEFDSEQDADLYALADNRLQELTAWDDDGLQAILAGIDADERALVGFDPTDLPPPDVDGEEAGTSDTSVAGSLQTRFGVPPFTVLDARQGYWQARKAAWLSLGIASEVGRGPTLPGLIAATAFQNGTYKAVESASLKGGLTFGMSCSPYASKGKEIDGGAAKAGTSIFDPVLTELLVRWFSPVGGTVLDPFAGGSVRGIVTAAVGRAYVGIELRPEQVAANREQWEKIGPRLAPVANTKVSATVEDYTPDLTPVQAVTEHMGARTQLWLKRDDLFAVAGVRGGKVRSCWALAQAAKAAGVGGLVTAGSRQSPQVNIVAHIAARLGLGCRVHTPNGTPSAEVQQAVDMGAELVQHKAGYNNVIVSRAHADAKALGWTEIPFGMECDAAITATRAQVANLPADAARLVVPVGSGMSLAGILHGLRDVARNLPVLGVVVGADPTKRLDRWAPTGWRDMVTLVEAGVDYHDEVEVTLGEVQLDPVYEAKCARYLVSGDVLWCVGIRATAQQAAPGRAVDVGAATWVEGDSNAVLVDPGAAIDAADFVFTCPPYADLEVYSDDPADISGMPYPDFLATYRSIIAKACARLKSDRFAAIVIGDVRAPDGTYRNLVSDTIQAFLDAGLRLYNEAILVTSLGSLPVRAGRQFQAGRKLGKTHQNVLVFVKGSAKAATLACGDVDFGADDEPQE